MVFKAVYDLVRSIPEGRVLTYGLISHKLGGRLSAQGVGWALKALGAKKKSWGDYDSSNVPWHRVVNSQGGISTGRNTEMPPDLQKKLLRREGVKFNKEDKIDLSVYLWAEVLND